MTTLTLEDVEFKALRALEIQEVRNRNIDRILAEAKERSTYKPWTEIDNASDTDQFIEARGNELAG